MYVSEVLGAKAVTTTKYHAKCMLVRALSTDGGNSRLSTAAILLEKKKTKADLCISREVLAKDTVRKVSRRARGYMMTYKLLEKESQKKVAQTGKTNISYDKIEHLKRLFHHTELR